ncbi:MAG: pyridoxamine 5'-phosphate oxidase family protein [Candidatus Hodarchaeales archaeon]|jgi:uncharacterized pyridoxamine 5'-phosphate oxidase family protein
MQSLTQKQVKKLRKLLASSYFIALSTSYNDIPQATMVQLALTKDWKILVIADSATKKARNIRENKNVWLIADKTRFFRIPRAIYIKGTAQVYPVTEENYQEFLSYHSWVTKRILNRLAKNRLNSAVMIEITPTKFITFGIFGKMTEQSSFRVPSE